MVGDDRGARFDSVSGAHPHAGDVEHRNPDRGVGVGDDRQALVVVLALQPASPVREFPSTRAWLTRCPAITFKCMSSSSPGGDAGTRSVEPVLSLDVVT